MKMYRPVNLNPDDNLFTQVVEVWDFGRRSPIDVPLFPSPAYLDISIGIIRADGTRALHRGSHYELTSERCCIVVTREGRRYASTREGVNNYLARQLQHTIIELEAS